MSPFLIPFLIPTNNVNSSVDNLVKNRTTIVDQSLLTNININSSKDESTPIKTCNYVGLHHP